MRLFTVMSTAYETFDNTIRKYLNTAFNTIGMSGSNVKIYNIIFNGIKGIMQNIMFYIEDAFTEQNVFTASRKSSVYSLAKMTGYDPYYGSSASGTIIGTVVRGAALESDATKIYIPNHTVIVNRETNIRYIIELASNEYLIDITKPLVSHEFKIVEGNERAAMFYAQGLNLETFSIAAKFSFFDKEYITVTVNGKPWKEVESLYDMGEDDECYVVSGGYDGTFDVMFGNGSYGKVLRSGDVVAVSWISHTGEGGNILDTAETNFYFYSGGRDTYGNVVDINKFMTISMKTCIAGGTNPDDIKFIRKMIGYNSRSMILATEESFTLFFKRFSFIGRVNCWSHESTMKVLAVCTSNQLTKVTTAEDYFALNINNLYLANEYKRQILEALTLSNKTFAGISLEFKDPVFVRYAATCVVKVKDRYNTDAVKEKIRQFLGEYFMDLEEGVQVIYKSDIIQKVLNTITDIESFDIHFISEKNETAAANGYYDKYSIDYINGNLIQQSSRVYYDSAKIAGLDDYGNIKLDSKLEIPLLQGGFLYYDKDDVNRGSSIRIDTLQYIFIN